MDNDPNQIPHPSEPTPNQPSNNEPGPIINDNPSTPPPNTQKTVSQNNKKNMFMAGVFVFLFIGGIIGYIFLVPEEDKTNQTQQDTEENLEDGPENDAIRKADLSRFEAEIFNSAANNNGSFPTDANIADSEWIASNMPDVKLTDPTGVPYVYEAFPVGCDNVSTPCRGYTLTATLSDGTTETRTDAYR